MALTIRVSVPASDAEWVSDLLWGLGVVAIEELVGIDDSVILRTSMGEDRDTVHRALASLPVVLEWSFEVVDDRVVDAWREHVRPFEVGHGLLVVPAWNTEPVADGPRTRVTIEPGATFGMGDHPTTRGCLGLLERMDVGERSVLDVGCGSGILGIVALMMGARTAHGVDINPASIEVSRLNAEMNGVNDRWTVSQDQPDAVHDVVFANILAPVLIDLSEEISRRVSAHGVLILSGVLEGRYEHVLAEYPEFVVTERTIIDGWASLLLSRR
jgi:ribosomal protein L11 methyltransferase